MSWVWVWVGWLVGLLWLVGGVGSVWFGLVCSVWFGSVRFGGFNWYFIWFVLLIVCYFKLVWFGFGVFGSVVWLVVCCVGCGVG